MLDNKTKQINTVIFGAGRLCKRYLRMKKDCVNIISICDNDSSLWGHYIDDIKIVSLETVLNIDYDVIFILSHHSFEIRKQLVDLGIDMLKVYDLDHIGLLFPSDKVQSYLPRINDSANKEIVLLSHALTASGANVVLIRSAELFLEMGYKVSVISRQDGELREKYFILGADVYITNDILDHIAEFHDILVRSDLILINTFWFYYILQEMDYEYKSKSVWWIHETFPFSVVSKEQFDICIQGVKVVAAVSTKVDKTLKDYYNFKDSWILPYGIPYRRASSKENENIVFALIGTFDSSIKGQDIFLKAIGLLSDADRDRAEFWFVGPGTLKDEEYQMCEMYHNIKILGCIEQEKIPDLYSKVDVVVCASRQEALSVVSVEAFMNEKLAIISDAAGIVDYIEPGADAIVFPSGDAKSLADSIRWVINNREAACEMGYKSRRVYDNFFSMSVFRERLDNLTKEVIYENTKQ